jgi:enoyl-CoA hydratase
MKVLLDIRDDVALITMDDGKMNAITPAAMVDLNAAFDKAEADARAVVLAGRPGSFCAGFHLSTMQGDDQEATRALSLAGGYFALRLFSFPKPLVAACTGHGFTIGAIWMAGCDTRIGEFGSYKHGMTETKLGMPLTAWALAPLQTRLSMQYWIPAIAQSRLFDPEEAVAAGFLDEVVPEGRSIERACTLAAELAELPADAYAHNKLVTRQDGIEIMRADLRAR